ncbi:MAG: beta-lactamase family protein [Promicromonosporaceae bacterium]|nr:beta-lactamase family protein [Promicromonosporaceae bacterium]
MRVLAENLSTVAEISGFSGVIRVDDVGGVPFEAAFGLANRAYGVANRTDTRFGTASITKAFTALAVAALVDDGLLSFDSPVRPILGADLPLIDEAVTVRQLLNHTSGISDYWDESNNLAPVAYDIPTPLLATAEQFLPLLAGRPQVSEPGQVFSYNNGAFCVAAIVAERVSGTPFHDLVAARVFAAAGMTRSAYLRQDELPGDAAIGYLHREGLQNNVLLVAVRGGGDGGAYTTAGDLTKFWRALLADQIVSGELRKEMLTPTNPAPRGWVDRSYGLGFWLGGEYMLQGGDRGVSTWTQYNPDTGQIMTLLSNVSEGIWPLLPIPSG